MRTSPEPGRPRVYVCSAEADQPTAARLLEELRPHRIGTFYLHTDLLPGDQIVEHVERRLGSSDYFLLVWSRACADHSAVYDQWAAYLLEKVHQKQGFLLVLRLDNSPLPPLLGIRRLLDAYEDWESAVAELLECCSRDRDRALDLAVLPAPIRPTDDGQPTAMLYIRNKSFGVYHVMATPKDVTGASLMAEIRHRLALPPESKHPFGLRLEYEYQPFLDEKAIDPHMEVGLTDDTVIDLQVRVYYSVKEERRLVGEYRPLPHKALSAATRDRLLRKAFGHLLPHDR